MTQRAPVLFRPLFAALLALLLGLGLAGCGTDEAEDPGKDSSSPAGDVPEGGGLDQVTITGKLGSEPKVSWKGPVSVTETETETVIEGDGPKATEGTAVFAHLWIGNGTTEKSAFTTYTAGTPEVVTIGDPQIIAALSDAMADQPIGSRIVVAAPPAAAFGEQGSEQLGVGPKDSVVFVIDMIDALADGPDGKAVDPAGWAPKIVEKDGEPSSLDFAGTPRPGKTLRSTFVIRGNGPKVKKGQTIYVNYLGQVYGGKKPFDASYPRDTPFSFPVGAGQVVTGWDEGLEGIPVGSRVILAIPPDKGYGTEGNPQAGIKGTDTLYFVVDVLGAL